MAMNSGTNYQYQRIYDDLIRRIEAGEFAPGGQMPTELALSAQYKVSRITSKKALNMLAERGVVWRRSGKGTFLATGAARKAEVVPKRHVGDRVLGLVADRLLQSFGLTLFYELDRAAREAGFRLYLRNTDCSQAREAEEIDYLRRIGAEGIFVIPARAPYYNPAILQMVLDHYPVHLLDSALMGIEVPFVATDNRAGGEQLVDRLIEQGHRHIALATADMKTTISLQDRHSGYERALRRHGLLYQKEYVLDKLQSSLDGVDAAAAAAQDMALLTSFFCAHPEVTGVMVLQHALVTLVHRAAEAAGRNVPGTLSIAVFDEVYDAMGGYTYTHVKQDEARIAQEAMRRMSDTLQGAKVELSSYIRPTMLIGQTTDAAVNGLLPP